MTSDVTVKVDANEFIAKIETLVEAHRRPRAYHVNVTFHDKSEAFWRGDAYTAEDAVFQATVNYRARKIASVNVVPAV